MRRCGMDPCELLGVSVAEAAAECASEPPPRLRPPSKAELCAEEQRPPRAEYAPPARIEGFAPAGGPSRKGVNVAWVQTKIAF